MKTMVAMICIGVVLLVAMNMGFNGVLMSTGIGVIAGLGGFSVRKYRK